MLRQFRADPLPVVLANGKANPAFLHRGPTRPLSAREHVVCDLVAEAMDRGNANLERHFLEEALFEYETAIAVMPEFPHAHWNRGQVLLMLGRYDEGFAEFDWRFKMFGDVLWHKGIPIWCGEDLKGKRLLCWHEHGYGDTLMVLRYLPVLQGLGARLTLAVPEQLRRLVRRRFSDVEVLNEVPKLWRRFDYRCPLFNLLPVMQQIGIPIPSEPYLAGGPRDVRDVIGVAWSGNREHGRDRHRSIDICQFMSLLDSANCDLQSVQTHEQDDALAHGVRAANYRDFADTAEQLMAMRHVVTVDTAVAHLAGAIGHPSLHLLVPHVMYWPWYRAADWYPRINVYRQPRPGNWDSVFAVLNFNLWSCQ